MGFYTVPPTQSTGKGNFRTVTKLNKLTGTVDVIAGSGIAVDVNGNVISIGTGNNGSVGYIGIVCPSELTVSNSPVTSAGEIELTWTPQAPNRVFHGDIEVGPGGDEPEEFVPFALSSPRVPGSPLFKSLQSVDIPSHLFSGHTVSNLTSGNFLRATGSTTFGFQALTDLPTHTHSTSEFISEKLPLARGGTNNNWSSPANDALVYYNWAASSLDWLNIGTGVQISGGSLLVDSSSLGLIAGTGLNISGATISLNLGATFVWDGSHDWSQAITFAAGQTFSISQLYKSGSTLGDFVLYTGGNWTTLNSSLVGNNSCLSAVSDNPSWVPTTTFTFVATNDGSQDVTSLLQSYFDTKLQNGGELIIPEGTYLLKDVATWQAASDDAKLIVRGVGNVVFKRGTNDAITTQGGIKFVGKLSNSETIGVTCIPPTPIVSSATNILESDPLTSVIETQIQVGGNQTSVFKAGNTVKLVSENMIAGSLKQPFVLTLSGSSTYTLTVGGQTTIELNQSSTANAIQSALEDLSSVGLGKVKVTGAGPFNIAFHYGAHPNVPFAITLTKLTGGGTVVLSGDKIQRSGECASISSSTYSALSGTTTIHLSGTARSWLDGYTINARLYAFKNSSVQISNLNFECTDTAFANTTSAGMLHFQYLTQSLIHEVHSARSASPFIIIESCVGSNVISCNIKNASSTNGCGILLSQTSRTIISDCQFSNCRYGINTQSSQTDRTFFNAPLRFYGRTEYTSVLNCTAVACAEAGFSLGVDAYISSFDNCISRSTLGPGFIGQGMYASFYNCHDNGSVVGFKVSVARGAYISASSSYDAILSGVSVIAPYGVSSEIDSSNDIDDIYINHSHVVMSRIRQNNATPLSTSHGFGGRIKLDVKDTKFTCGVSNSSKTLANGRETITAWDSSVSACTVIDLSNTHANIAATEIDAINLLTSGAQTIVGVSSVCTTTLTSPSLSVAVVGTTGSTVYSYRVSALNALGETLACSAVTVSNGKSSLDVSNYNTLSWNSVSGATSYNVYGRSSGTEIWLANVNNRHFYNDIGADLVSTTPPVINQSGGLSKLDLKDIVLNLKAGASQTLTAFASGVNSKWTVNNVHVDARSTSSLTVWSLLDLVTPGQFCSIMGKRLSIDASSGTLSNLLLGGVGTVTFSIDKLVFSSVVPNVWYDQCGSTSSVTPYVFASWESSSTDARLRSSANYYQLPKAGFTLKISPIPVSQVGTIESSAYKIPGALNHARTIVLETAAASYVSASLLAPHHAGQTITLVNLSGFTQTITDGGGALANNQTRRLMFDGSTWMTDGPDETTSVQSTIATCRTLPVPVAGGVPVGTLI